jgi:hypothetical protein
VRSRQRWISTRTPFSSGAGRSGCDQVRCGNSCPRSATLRPTSGYCCTQLWLSGRYDRSVYVLSTADGHLIHKIAVGNGLSGLCVWPQPGRYSVGHTGITR